VTISGLAWKSCRACDGLRKLRGFGCRGWYQGIGSGIHLTIHATRKGEWFKAKDPENNSQLQGKIYYCAFVDLEASAYERVSFRVNECKLWQQRGP
jgi:hypothetical protein